MHADGHSHRLTRSFHVQRGQARTAAMKPHLSLRVLVAVAALAAATAAHSAGLRPEAPAAPASPAVSVAANCSAIGQSVAAQEGGQLLRASAVDRGGRTVCVITYTVPSRDGRPPRRVETTVDAG